MNKVLHFLLFLILVTSNVQAQTARWAIAPDYESIEKYSDNLYKVRIGDSFGVIDKNGIEIVPVSIDSLTTFSEGVALALKYDEKGNCRLKGLVREEGRYITISEEWFIKEFPFFSEGKLPVCNAMGWYGFINTSGNLVLDFKYSRIYPFSEGYAVVSKMKINLNIVKLKPKVIYINDQGEELTLASELGSIYFATSFKHGEALVRPKNGQNYIINRSGRITRIENNVDMRFDNKMALDDDIPELQRKSTVIYDGPTTFIEGNKYGYRTTKNILLPSQFDNATPFSKGYATASINGKVGLLKLLPEKFSISAVPGNIQSENQNTESIEYHVKTPKEWQNRSLTLKCEVNGKPSTLTVPGNNSEIRIFSFMLEKGNRSLTLTGDRITLLAVSEESIASPKQTSYKDLIKVTVSPTKVKANVRDLASVGVSVTNNSETALKIKITVSGDGIKTSVKEYSLAKGAKAKPLYINFSTKGMRAKENKNLTVKVEIPGSSEAFSVRKRIEVEPFFSEF